MSSLRTSYSFIAKSGLQPVYIGLTKNNDGVSIAATEDYSPAGLGETRFFFEVGPNQWFNIVRFRMQVGIGSLPAINEYGNILALPNGIDWFARIKGVETFITPFGPVKDNEGLFRLGGDNFASLNFQGNDSILQFGDDINLFSDGFVLTEGDQMGVILRDDFSAIIKHEFQLKARAYVPISRAQS